MDVASVVLDALVLVGIALHLAYSVVQTSRRHDENTTLLTFIELQVRRTRHAVKNLAAALHLQAIVADLDGNGDDIVDEEEVAK